MQRRALILSPFASVPRDAGQRKRVDQTTQMLKDLGYEITFFLYAFEDGWKTRANEAWLKQMRAQWDEVIVWRANPNVGTPPVRGHIHGIDEWWDEGLEVELKQIFGYRFYDAFVVHNVWLSKAFDFAPRGTVRILDSHDVFSTRLTYFDPAAGTPEFFLTDKAMEVHGANRADIVLGIQDNDAAWFARHAKPASVCVPYDGEAGRRVVRDDYLHKDKVVFGFLGSGHIFNVRGLTAYCTELARLVGQSAAPVELRIGGQICQSIPAGGPWVLCGKVADEDAFFDDVDIIVAPVFEGSGFKVKVADAVARGMPIVTAAHAAIGMNFDKRVVAANAHELARMTANIALHRPLYRGFQNISEDSCLDLKARTARGTQKLERKIGAWPCAILYDLTGLTAQEASCVLLSWSGAFHLMRFLAKQLVVAPEPLRSQLEGIVPTGVFFASEEDVRDHARQIWRWITVKNLNPEVWGAKLDQILVDEAWRGVFEDAADAEEADTDAPCDHAMYWHNITWDLMVQDIVRNARGAAANRADRRSETVFVVDRRRREGLEAPMHKLFPKLGIASLETFEDFFQLMMRVAAGELRRLVIAEPDYRPRQRILRKLCAIRGIEFVGMAEQGTLSLGRMNDSAVKDMYAKFEEQWRFKRDTAETQSGPDGKGVRLRGRASP